MLPATKTGRRNPRQAAEQHRPNARNRHVGAKELPKREFVRDGKYTYPLFQGWIIDLWHRECRRNDPDQGMIKWSLDTPEGKALFAGWMEETYCLPKGVSLRDP
jgi:hypothetical protein